MTPIVRLTGVCKRFGSARVLENVGFEVFEGERLAIGGTNGSGKSVLLRIMCRMLMPDSGSVWIDSRFQAPRSTFPQEFGIIIDRPGFQALKTGSENLAELARIRRKVGNSAIVDALERVGLDPSLKQRVGQYSLGMKQKLALAQAIMEDQAVLLLDEPFNALDADSVTRVRALLLELSNEGKTMVFCSHNADDVTELATRRLLLSNGQVNSEPVGR